MTKFPTRCQVKFADMMEVEDWFFNLGKPETKKERKVWNFICKRYDLFSERVDNIKIPKPKLFTYECFLESLSDGKRTN